MILPSLRNQDYTHKKVLVRVDLNVPMEKGEVTDISRFLAIKETVDYLIKQNAQVVLLSHFGRPKSTSKPAEWDSKFSLKSLAEPLSAVLSCPVHFIKHYKGLNVLESLKLVPSGAVLLLENVRFDPGEECNDLSFAKDLSQGFDFFVNEAFSCSHRAHASVEGITNFLPSLAGINLEREITYLAQCLTNPMRPLAAIIGGSKVSTKLDLLVNLSQKVDHLIIGGAMANTFLAAKGYSIGQSLYEPHLISVAEKILKESSSTLLLPVDGVVACSLESTESHSVKFSEEEAIEGKIFDIGTNSITKIKDIVRKANTVVWNGPLGAFEYPSFSLGTLEIAKILAQLTQDGILTVAGGGDTLAALEMAKVKDRLTYASTAGGAFLEWLEGKKLPGVEALLKR